MHSRLDFPSTCAPTTRTLAFAVVVVWSDSFERTNEHVCLFISHQVISLGEFVRVLKRMKPPLPFVQEELDSHSGAAGGGGGGIIGGFASGMSVEAHQAQKQKMFSMYTAMDASGRRTVRLVDFV